MTFNACIDAAAEAGQISQRRARQIKDEIERKARRKRQALGAEIAQLQAADEVAEELRHQGIRTRRNAILAENARQRLVRDLTRYRTIKGEADMFEAAVAVLSHYGYAGFPSVRGSAQAITSLVHARLGDAQLTLKRKGVLGRRSDTQLALTNNIVKEVFGEGTGDTAAKGFADAIAAEFEYLRQRFNAAGGEIGKLDNYFPQTHDRRLMLRDGQRSLDKAEARDRWKTFIRPLLDVERMRQPLTGRALADADLDEALDRAWDNITSDGFAHLTPQGRGQGRGSLANQRAEHRFLVFQDADSWLAYNQRFGKFDPVQSVFQHIGGMAQDIAALERLGPNPDATVDWLIQLAQREGGRQLSGLDAAIGKMRRSDPENFIRWRLQSLWTQLRGRATANERMTNAATGVRNWATAANLGATGVLAAMTDPALTRAAERLAGLPQARRTLDFVKVAFGKGSRDDLVRAGFLWDEYVHVMRDEVRGIGAVEMNGWSQWLVDRAMTWNGLKAVTTARKGLFLRGMHDELGKRADRKFADLDPETRDMLTGFGIDADAWNVMRQGVDEGGFLTPPEIVRRTGNVEIAERYGELLDGFTERAVPSGTPNTQSWVLGTAERGEIFGYELPRFALQYKSWALSATGMQIEAISRMAAYGQTPVGGVVRGAKYAFPLFLHLTLMGGVYLQFKSLMNGQDTRDVTDPAFWGEAMFQGGGLGLYGDFFRMSENRFGQSPIQSLMGPGPQLIGDTTGLAFDAVQLALSPISGNEDAAQDLTRSSLRYARRWTPVLSSHFATRLAYQRLILDQLQHLADPNAHRSFRSRATSLRNRTGQDYWWAPGDAEPERQPDVSSGFGSP